MWLEKGGEKGRRSKRAVMEGMTINRAVMEFMELRV